MTGHSILYLGHGDFAREYLAELETLPVCALLTRGSTPGIPAHAPSVIDLVLVETGPTLSVNGSPLADVLPALADFPVIALTDRAREQRGIAAQLAGVGGYVCVDDITLDTQESLFDHVVRRHRFERRLSATDAGILSILADINDGVIVVDDDGHVLDINPAGRSILGLAPRSLPDGDWEQTFCCIDGNGNSYRNAADLPLVRARRGEKFTDQVATYRAPGLPDTMLSINGHGLFDGDGRLAGGVATFRDVTETTRRAAELQRLARYDELTGLPDAELFTEHLTRAMGRAQRRSSTLALLSLNVDRFRSVNETLGHDVGDGLLQAVAKRLRDNLRVGDYVGRRGGDEFLVCLEDFSESRNVAAAAQKILLVLSERFDIAGSAIYATPSIGIAMYPDAGKTGAELLHAAELATAEAKKRGGGRFQFYSDALNNRLEQREELEVGLRHALVRNEFALHYQPRIDVTTGRLIGLEALLRWQHPRFGLLHPGRFLPLLESSGLIHSAGEWVVGAATRQLAGWQRRFELPDLSIAVNLSPQQLLHGRLVDVVASALADNALDPGCIEFEIRDGHTVYRREAEMETLRGLRRLGVRLSLDHFGTGDLSFESLDGGVIDSFVLDRALINDVGENHSHQRIVRAAIAMAQGLDIEVTAEGVETLTQFEFLRDCHCDLAQGFLISRPMQPEKVAGLLRSEIAGTRLLARGMP